MNKKFIAILLSLSLLLTACQTYNQEVELTEDQRASYQDDLTLYTSLIESFYAKDYETMNELLGNDAGDENTVEETNITAMADEDLFIEEIKGKTIAPIEWYVEKARAEERLGLYDEAIATLKEAARKYEISSPAWHNLAKLYEDVHECRKAEKYYLKLIEVMKMNRYYLDIAKCYVENDGNPRDVEAYYNKYKEFYPDSTNSRIEKYINN